MKQPRRRRNQPEFKVSTAVKAFSLCLLMALGAIGYVLQSHENIRLRTEREKLLGELGHYRAERMNLTEQLNALHSPLNIEQAVVHHGLDLVRSTPDQVAWLRHLATESPMVAQRIPGWGDSAAERRVP